MSWSSINSKFNFILIDIFKEQPNSTEVTEPDVATFGCSIENQMFSIFWFVNGSDAGYARFQQRGVNIETISYTESILHIVGYKENNNTLVHCAILMEYPQLMWVNSRIASLRGHTYMDAYCVEPILICIIQRLQYLLKAIYFSAFLL